MGADEEGMHERLQTHLRELRSLNREIAAMKPPTLGSFLTLCWSKPDSNPRSHLRPFIILSINLPVAPFVAAVREPGAFDHLAAKD